MNPQFVIDASITMAWCFGSEATPKTSAVLEHLKSGSACVPSWWSLEIANVLVLAERRRRITPAEASRFIGDLERLRIETDESGMHRAFTDIMSLARDHRLTAYDAGYLELAVRRRLPIATLDNELRKACRALGVELLDK